MTPEATKDTGLLAIYLNDHLAGATAGAELARRAAGSNRGSTYALFFEELAAQIEEDRESLLEIMEALGVGVDRLKLLAAWSSEKIGRLKRNGSLWDYSSLSRVLELEMLMLGVQGKLALWRSLQHLEGPDGSLGAADLPRLASRAQRQLQELEEHRLHAVNEALG